MGNGSQVVWLAGGYKGAGGGGPRDGSGPSMVEVGCGGGLLACAPYWGFGGHFWKKKGLLRVFSVRLRGGPPNSVWTWGRSG